MSGSNDTSATAGSSARNLKRTGKDTFKEAFAFLQDDSRYKAMERVEPLPPTQVSTAATTVGAITNTNVASNAPTISSKTILVNAKQRGNPLLKHITNSPHEFSDAIQPDYVMTPSTCAFFLSLRYHKLHSDYIYQRTTAPQYTKNYRLAILLCQVDVDDHQQSIRELTKLCILNQMTLILCFSPQEAAFYIQTYKSLENKSAETLKPKPQDKSHMGVLTDCLCTVKSVNKTDVVTLANSFKSFKRIVEARPEELSLLPGFGEKKAKKLHKIFNTDFRMIPRRRFRRNFGCIVLLLSVGLLLFTLWDYANYFRDNIVSHLSFTLKENGYSSCGFRIYPQLLKHDDSMLILYETNCPYDGSIVYWGLRSSGSKKNDSNDDRIQPALRYSDEQNNRYIYEAAIPPIATKGIYTYSVLLKSSHDKFAKHRHSKSTNCLSPSSADGGGGSCRPIRIAALSDNQFGARIFGVITQRISKLKPHYVMHVGDAVQQTTPRSWHTDFFDILEKNSLSGIPLIHVQGNHDDETVSDSDVTKKPFYLASRKTATAFSLGSARFILLNSNVDSDEQLRWLERELLSPEAQKAIFRIVLVHIPPFIEFWDPETWAKGEDRWGWFVREKWLPLMQRHGVDLIMSGHQHNYQRGLYQNITLTILGGSGGELEHDRVKDWNLYSVVQNKHHYVLMDIYDDILLWNAYDLQGNLIDSFVLRGKSLP